MLTKISTSVYSDIVFVEKQHWKMEKHGFYQNTLDFPKLPIKTIENFRLFWNKFFYFNTFFYKKILVLGPPPPKIYTLFFFGGGVTSWFCPTHTRKDGKHCLFGIKVLGSITLNSPLIRHFSSNSSAFKFRPKLSMSILLFGLCDKHYFRGRVGPDIR